MNAIEVIIIALNQLISQLVGLLPKLIIALIIWYIGRYVISVGVSLVKNLDTKKTKLDSKAVAIMATMLDSTGRIILVLVILDYLGIGSSIIGALAQGVTYAVAIALGLAFGKALEGDAKDAVTSIKKFLSR